MSDLVTLAEGGIAVLVMGTEFEVPKLFAMHPQLHVMPVKDLPDSAPAVAAAFPPNTRVVLIGGELPKLSFAYVRGAAERKNVPWSHRRNQPALAEVLSKVLAKDKTVDLDPSATAAAAAAAVPDEPQRRGAVGAFVQEVADLHKGAAEEARRLFPLAQGRGITTTLASLAQAISNAKRKGGFSGAPKSIQSAQGRALDTLDESISGLQLIREYVASVEKENSDLKAKLQQFREAWEKLAG